MSIIDFIAVVSFGLTCINANIRMYRNDHLKMYKITL